MAALTESLETLTIDTESVKASKNKPSNASQNDTQGVDASQNDTQDVDASQNDTQSVNASHNDTQDVNASQNDTQSVNASQNDTQSVNASQNNTQDVDVSQNDMKRVKASKRKRDTASVELLINKNYVYPIATMYGAKTPWRAPEFPLIVPSNNHAVLYRIPQNGFQNGPPQAYVGATKDKWDNKHVRMPCSEKSLYETTDVSGTSLQSRWKMIESALTKPIKNSHDLANAILRYNTKFKHTWTFDSLHEYFEEYLDVDESRAFFKHTLPVIVKLALDLPKLIKSPIPLLTKDENKSLSMSQLQIASLLANAFFCTFPRRNTTGPGTEYSEYPRINFIDLYESDAEGIMEKLNCICSYFERVCQSVPTGVVTFSRRHVPSPACPDWERSDVTIDSIPLYVDDRTSIEDANGLIQVNFSNKYLGGAVLDNGLVQQEIRFLICPELMASMLFTEALGPNEAFMVLGCERYNNYTGYGSYGFQWTGEFHDDVPYDGSGRRRCAVLSIDALMYDDEDMQYRRDKILRELNKAWIGFSFYMDLTAQELQYPGVATGNWGCGSFGGDPQLKSIIQIMACVQARRPIAYFTFKDARLKEDVIKVYNLLRRYNVNVGDLFKLLIKYCNTDGSLDLRVFLKKELKKKNKPASYVQFDSSTPGSSASDL